MYRARDERLDRDVAIKVLPPGALREDSARKRFRNEALAISKLNHANVATVYEFDSVDGIDFLVMEYVAGATLADKLGTGSLPDQELIEIAEQIVSTMQLAHESGIVHCDLKPGNIMVTPKGQVKLLDFGLAKLLVTPKNEDVTTSATISAPIPGTLAYMAPEQLRGEPADVRTDLYSMGAVLYQMATGHRPFEDKTTTVLMSSILHRRPPPPVLFNASIRRHLQDIILKCLEKDAGRRYQSAKELVEDLQRLRQGMPLQYARPHRARQLLPLGIVAALVVVAFTAWLLARNRRHPTYAGGGITSMAVLPLENLSHDQTQDYFADGMTDELIADLSKVKAIRVISRTSVMQYKGVNKPLPEIAQALKVDAIVVGSVLHAGNRVRINAQLVHAADDRQLWSESYERDLRDVLSLQRDVARTIVQEINVTLTSQEKVGLRAAQSVNPEAYEDYLHGRFNLNERTPAALQKAVTYFQHAIAKQPDYALAYAGLADGYGLLPGYSMLPASEALPKSRAAAEKALQLDPELAEPRTALANVAQNLDWDWAGAEDQYRRALDLSPSYATAHHWYALYLAALGRTQEALKEIRRAQELDPLSPIIASNVAWIHYLARQYDRAIEQARKTLELYPQFPVAHEYLGQAYAETGDSSQAVAELQKAAALASGDLSIEGELAYALALSHQKQQALTVISQMGSRSRVGSAYPFAMAYAGLGDGDATLKYLEQAYRQHDVRMGNLRVHPAFQRFHPDRRFQELLRKLGLPE